MSVTNPDYHLFTPCCGGATVSLRVADAVVPTNNRVYLYSSSVPNAPTALTVGQCYTVEIKNDKAAADVAALPLGPMVGQLVGPLDNCNHKDSDVACPDCPTPCYTLISCTGKRLRTITDLSAYVNTFITINDSSECWFVHETPDECGGVTLTVTYASACSSCTCTCYDITGTGTVSYVGCDNVYYENVLLPVKICSLVTPRVTGAGTITTGSACVDGKCPEVCYSLTECTSGTVINSKSPGLFAYVGKVVSIEGQTGCYTVAVQAGVCECPIDVIVSADYVDCTACKPTIAYRLISCDKEDQIIYTTQDLSAYKDKVVELDDPCGCYTVEEINVKPPSDVTVSIKAGGFDTCTECKTTYYKLTSCDAADPITYTSTNLAAYVNKVIQLVGCEKCFTVTEFTGVPTNPVQVTFHSEYTDCATCLKSFTCRCSTIYNEGTTAATFTYIDCNGNNQTTASIPAKGRSERYCVIRWTTGTLPLYHGNCTQADADSPWTCPAQAYPVKKIKPGYNTPACSIEKYEKISCNFGEQLYKSVVEKRYGVSSCCPEEIDKWTIKKELIELQALVDPNYTCVKLTSGCGCDNTTSCNCGCGCGTCTCSTLKTCSS
jgi:hypothetical protein